MLAMLLSADPKAISKSISNMEPNFNFRLFISVADSKEIEAHNFGKKISDIKIKVHREIPKN